MIDALLEEELLTIQDKNLYRRLKVLKPIDSVHAYFEQKEVTLFCGNDYLGLSHHPQVVAAIQKSVKSYGAGSGASRLISGTTDLHVRLEEEIANWRSAEKAVLYSAGYLANLGVLTALASEGDLVVLDKLCHASIIDAAKLSQATVRVFPHKNYKRCEEILERNQDYRRRFIISDTVFSMDGDLADVEKLVDLRERYQCCLILDDAHGTGVLGLEGKGILEDAALEGKVDVVTGTLSKALGCLGGFAVGSKKIIDYLINTSRPFIFATAPSPVLCAGALAGIEMIRLEPHRRHRLWQNTQKIHEYLTRKGWMTEPITSPILPLILGDEKKALEAAEFLLKKGFLVPAVRYPTVSKGKARLRITASAAHDDQDLEGLFETLDQLL